MYKTAMKFINLLKLTKSLANIESEAVQYGSMDQEAGLDAEVSLGVEAEGLTAMDTATAAFKSDDFRYAFLFGDDDNILSFFAQSN
jgi:hypothetical protein